MPAAPEFLRAARLVRRIEVLGQVEAEEHRHARGNVRVSGEVGVYLQGITEQGRQVLVAAVQQGVLKHAVGKVHRQIIGQDELFQKAVHDPEDGYAEPPAAQIVRFVQLLDKLHGTHDGTGHQLREEAQVKAEVQEIGHRGNLAALHVHNIAHRLEGEEGNTHRQHDGIYPENGRAGKHIQEFSQDIVYLDGQAEEVVHEVRDEIGVLEIGQYAQIYHHAQGS